MSEIMDVIKEGLMEEFAAISLRDMALALALAFALGLFIAWVYRLTYQGVLFSRSFAGGLVLLTMTTAMVILAISANIVLSLGMVGALSIVRFRTAVKDPLDTVFMFWAIAAGIVIGAGFIPIAITGTLLIGLLYILYQATNRRLYNRGYLVAIRYEDDKAKAVNAALEQLPSHRMRSKTFSNGEVELVLELTIKKNDLSRVERIRAAEGVHEVSIIAYNANAVV